MTIILSNDDGIAAPGLRALEWACDGWGSRVVVAPERCHSSMSHRVTTVTPIHVTELETGRFQTDGTPADCARLAIRCIAPEADWLIAGINRGGNLGVDTYLSGTVAAAREAALLGIRAIAVSQYVAPGREVDWQLTARRARRAIEYVFGQEAGGRAWWNINLPHPLHSGECEIVRCAFDPSPLDVRFERSGSDFRYAGSYHGRPRVPGHDVESCFGGEITVTRANV